MAALIRPWRSGCLALFDAGWFHPGMLAVQHHRRRKTFPKHFLPGKKGLGEQFHRAIINFGRGKMLPPPGEDICHVTYDLLALFFCEPKVCNRRQEVFCCDRSTMLAYSNGQVELLTNTGSLDARIDIKARGQIPGRVCTGIEVSPRFPTFFPVVGAASRIQR